MLLLVVTLKETIQTWMTMTRILIIIRMNMSIILNVLQSLCRGGYRKKSHGTGGVHLYYSKTKQMVDMITNKAMSRF